MTKFSLLGITAIVACTAFAAPAFAFSHHRPMHVANAYAEATYCAGHEPGNPYDKRTDYLGWSAWRVRGGWDPTYDYNCLPGR